MTALEVAFRYGKQPGAKDMRAMDAVRDVYGIRKITFKEDERRVRVEYDASRLTEDIVAAQLRRAGVDVREKLALA